jgi:hypothetical protein
MQHIVQRLDEPRHLRLSPMPGKIQKSETNRAAD